MANPSITADELAIIKEVADANGTAQMGVSRLAAAGFTRANGTVWRVINRFRGGTQRPPSIWTPDKLHQLEYLVQKSGWSAREIATALGPQFTKSCVIGKCHRIGLQLPKRENHSPNGRVASPHKQRVNRRAPFALKPKRKKFFAYNVVEFPTVHRCSLLELTNSSCRWPYGEPGQPDFFFCGTPGADLINGRPYCEFHIAKASADLNPEPRRRSSGRFILKAVA